MLHVRNTLDSALQTRNRTHLLQVMLAVNIFYTGLQYLHHHPVGCKLHNA